MNPCAATDEIEMYLSAPIDIIKVLYNNVIEGNWSEVVGIYHKHVAVHRVKITKFGDTAIHVAVSDGQYYVVKELVDIVHHDDLNIQNDLGNTPLHMAAIMGNVRMCACIARKNRGLIGIRNKENETPFFLAVLRGKRDAFLCLHSFCEEGEGYWYCRRIIDGDTILHAAIAGEYFDIASDIIKFYEHLIHSVNVKGLSPLHLLANRPAAFLSSASPTGFHKLIYNCIFVDETPQPPITNIRSWLRRNDPESEDARMYPENYQTCMSFVNNIRRLLGLSRCTQQADPEAPLDQDSPLQEASQIVNRPADSNKRPINQGHQFFLPENYRTVFNGFKLLSKIVWVIIGIGGFAENIRTKKEKHVWSIHIMEKLLEGASKYNYENNGGRPYIVLPIIREETTNLDGETARAFLFIGMVGYEEVFTQWEETAPPDSAMSGYPVDENAAGQKKNASEIEEVETPLLIAAKNGILEMVKSILKHFPVSIRDMNNDEKNIVLLAVENRHPHVYQFLQNLKIKENIFRQIDKDGNSALHLASKLGENPPWRIHGTALQMQWEINWFEFVERSIKPQFFPRYNNNGQTAEDIFTMAHEKLVEKGRQWLTSTSQSCSGIAALIATVAFTTSTTVPGGLNDKTGSPILILNPAFSIFSISSLIALCFSVMSLVTFLAILTSRYQEKDFGKDLPLKLLIGMTSLFISMVSMIVSFCSSHFSVLNEKLEYVAFLLYALACFSVIFAGVTQLPLYFTVAKATFNSHIARSYK